MAFRVGQKVQCINDAPLFFRIPGQIYDDFPLLAKKGEIYTVRQVCHDPFDGQPCLRLVEVVRKHDWPLNQGRFRPLVSTNISIFHSILANPHKELETA